MENLDAIYAKLAIGQTLTLEEGKFLAEQVKSLKDAKTDDVKPEYEKDNIKSLYKYLDQHCNKDLDVKTVFDFFAFLLEKVKDQTEYEPDTSYLNEMWGFGLRLEDCVKALSVFRCKSTNVFPTMKDSQVDLPNGEKVHISDYMVNKLIDAANKSKTATIDDIKQELTENLTSGVISPSEFLEKQLTVQKVENGEKVELPTVKPKVKKEVEVIVEPEITEDF